MGIFTNKKKGSQDQSAEDKGQTLSDVIRGLQYCVNTAAEITEEHYLSQLKEYFDEDGNPIMFQYKNSNDEIVEIPIFTLMNHAELILNEISIKMDLPIKYSALKTTKIEDKSIDDFYVSRSAFYLDDLSTNSKGGRGGTMEIEMKFKSGERPESVSRIVDQLMNRNIIKTPEDEWEDKQQNEEEKQ